MAYTAQNQARVRVRVTSPVEMGQMTASICDGIYARVYCICTACTMCTQERLLNRTASSSLPRSAKTNVPCSAVSLRQLSFLFVLVLISCIPSVNILYQILAQFPYAGAQFLAKLKHRVIYFALSVGYPVCCTFLGHRPVGRKTLSFAHELYFIFLSIHRNQQLCSGWASNVFRRFGRR